jgi:hypothetical protein
MKASDLISAIEEACFRPLFVEIALHERILLEEHEQQHLQAFEPQFGNRLTVNDRRRLAVGGAAFNRRDDGSAHGGAGDHDGKGADDGDRSGARRDEGSASKAAPAPPPSVRVEQKDSRSTSQRQNEAAKSRVAATKKALQTSTGTNERDEHQKARAKKETPLKEMSWEQVRLSVNASTVAD